MGANALLYHTTESLFLRSHTKDTPAIRLHQSIAGAKGVWREFGDHRHVLKVQHYGGILLAQARAAHVLGKRLKLFPELRLFSILKPLMNLKTVFGMRALRMLNREGSWSSHVHFSWLIQLMKV